MTPDTLLRWHRQLIAEKWTFARKSPGRPRVSPEVTEPVVKLARENPTAGFDRLQGLLANLGRKQADNTIKNILAGRGIEPAPRRGKRTNWKEFLRAHWETLAATDFFTAEVWTANGLITYFVLFMMEVSTRRVRIAGITTQPDAQFMTNLARELTNCEDGFLHGKSHLLMDRDAKFTVDFRTLLKGSNVEPVRLPPRSPNLNAHAERFVRSIKEECLNRLILFGEPMLRRAVSNFVKHYHTERNHPGLANRIIDPDDSVGRIDSEIVCRERLGGLLKDYHRHAA